jgi:5'-deoxynucleotidase YfbR-like HD superfamily hydrolase
MPLAYTDPVGSFDALLAFFHLSERLKGELRHSWLSTSRQESVAEHSWRMSLIVMMMAPMLGEPVDLLKALKMALLHDLPEALAGDVPVFAYQEEGGPEARLELERQAMLTILRGAPEPMATEFFDLWMEFEQQDSVEAKLVKAADKLEVQIQHNEAHLASWEHHEKLMVFEERWLAKYCMFNPVLRELAEAVKDEAMKKLAEAGEDVASLRTQARLP